MNHIEIAILFARSSSPFTPSELAKEIKIQAQNGNASNCESLADFAINHGLETGWLENYDDESYTLA